MSVAQIDAHGDFRIVMPPEACSYLPHETASLEYRVSDSMSAERFERLLARGWRRFSNHYFRPACPSCRECRSLRIDVNTFTPTKSQRRALRRNEHIRMVVSEPTVSEAHIELFNRYHADMHLRRGWPFKEVTVSEYLDGFFANVPFAREFRFYEHNMLLGVSLVDVTENASSSAYFFHAPEWRPLAPGTYSLLKEIEHGREDGRQYHYLGYWIRDCQSMAYKNRYGPNELLSALVDDHETPEWLAGNE